MTGAIKQNEVHLRELPSDKWNSISTRGFIISTKQSQVHLCLVLSLPISKHAPIAFIGELLTQTHLKNGLMDLKGLLLLLFKMVNGLVRKAS